MSFLTPLYLAGAALIALPIILHLLRRDVAPKVDFTAVNLLKKSPVDRSRQHRLRDLLREAVAVVAVAVRPLVRRVRVGGDRLLRRPLSCAAIRHLTPLKARAARSSGRA